MAAVTLTIAGAAAVLGTAGATPASASASPRDGYYNTQAECEQAGRDSGEKFWDCSYDSGINKWYLRITG
jgi:hypothetical protein